MVKLENTTTAFTIEKYHISETLGVVRGIVVRSRSIFGNIVAAIEILFGGNITFYETMCERAREQAFQMMVKHAEEHEANGIIGVRYDATELGYGVAEVLCYGTSVKIEPIAVVSK